MKGTVVRSMVVGCLPIPGGNAVRFFWVIILLFGILGVTDGWAAGDSDRSVLDRLQSFLDRTQTLEADFTQRSLTLDSGMPPESHGHFSSSKPGRFRWDYRAPNSQLILSDGQTVWFYEPDLEQVTVGTADYLDQTPAALLSSKARVEKLFHWRVTQDSIWQLPQINLIPKQEGPVQKVAIILHPKQDRILKLEVTDSLGNRSDFQFSAIVFNQTLDDKLFHFKVPPGVDVIQNLETK